MSNKILSFVELEDNGFPVNSWIALDLKELPQNFNFPYISTSIAEFWRRWHISLSSWLKEYLYFGLGGNRKGNVRTYINLIIVMFLGGLWHGIGLMIERFFSKSSLIKPTNNFIFKMIMMGFVFMFVSFSWLLFKLSSMNQAVNYIKAIKENTSVGDNYALILKIIIYSLPVIVYHLLYLAKSKNFKIANFIFKHDFIIYSIMLFLVLVNGGIPGAFVYFQF